jgi:hypothetical protein
MTMKNVFSLTFLVLIALLTIGCCNNGGTTPEPPAQPEPPEPPVVTPTPQRYLTLWGDNGNAGVTITQTPYQGETGEYVSITREQVAERYPDVSDEVLFPLDAEYFYWSNPDTDQTLYITKWADGTTSYSFVPFGSHDNYDKVSESEPIDTGAGEKITFTPPADPESGVQQMYYVSPDLNRSDYEETPTGENGEFKVISNSSNGQYL